MTTHEIIALVTLGIVVLVTAIIGVCMGGNPLGCLFDPYRLTREAERNRDLAARVMERQRRDQERHYSGWAAVARSLPKGDDQ